MKNLIAISILTLIGFNAFANDNAKKFIEGFINEDIAAFRTPNESMIGDEILWVSASILNGEFSKDQTKYEKKYDKQLVNIRTQASEVKTDLNGNSYIVVNGDNQSELVSIELKNKDDAANIKKGSKLDLICLGTKDNVKFPVLKDCVTADSYFQKYFEMTMNNMSQLKEEDTPKDILECSYLALKEFDIKNPGKLDEIELDNDDPDYVRETFYPVLSFLKEYTEKYNEVCKVFTMPNP